MSSAAEEEKSSSSSSVAVPASSSAAVSGSLTERRVRRVSASQGRGGRTKGSLDDLDTSSSTRTLTGLELRMRNVIPTPPVRATPFDLDDALADLESQMTGISSGSSGLVAPPVSSFVPTNFYISWPPSSHAASEEQRQKNNWISPRDLLVEKTVRTKTAAEFPSELVIHRQRHQAGLMGFQGDIPLEDEKLINPRATHAGGAAAKHFTGRVMNEVLSERNKETFTGAKPRTNGERNRNVGPGSYAGPVTPAVLARSASSFKPKPPKRFDALGLIQGPAPGTYNPSLAHTPRVPALHFGGTQKTHSRIPGGPGSHMANQTGALGTDPGGPGYYDTTHEPRFGGEPTALIIPRAVRFPDPSGASSIGGGIGAATTHAPGPGQYNIAPSVVGGIGAGRECVSFAAHAGSASAAAAVGFKRSSGPSVGTYNPTDGLDIGSSSLVGGSNTVSQVRPLHKFASSPRFSYHSRPHPLYALVVSSARQRASEVSRNFKPDLSMFQARRKEELLVAAKEARLARHHAAQATRLRLRTEHLVALDRIAHADLHRQQAREQAAATELDLFVRKGWLFYIALASRMQTMKENVRRVRTAKNLRLLTTNAARTIVAYARRWAAKARAKKVARSALIILSALRRNVVRASLRRKRRAARLLTILLLNRLNKSRALVAIASLKSRATLIQRAARDYLARREAATHHLLVRQWDAAEAMLADRYQTQEGEKAFEKIRKKGLLLKGMTSEQQRQKIIQEVPFDFISLPLKLSTLAEDYQVRVRAFRHAKYDWLRQKRRHDGLPDAVSIVDAAIATRAQRAEEAAQTGNTNATTPAVSSTGPSPTALAWATSASYAAAAVASGLPAPPPFDPSRPPVFRRLLAPLRLYWLLTTAQARQSASHVAAGNATVPPLDVETTKKYKKIITVILRAAAEEREKANASANAAAGATATNAKRANANSADASGTGSAANKRDAKSTAPNSTTGGRSARGGNGRKPNV